MTHKHWLILAAVVVLYFLYSKGSLGSLLGTTTTTA